MKFEGIIPALLTAYDGAGEVNCDAIARVVHRLINAGIGGLFVCGNTGEWWLLTEEEPLRIAERVMDAVAGRTRVYGTRRSVLYAQRHSPGKARRTHRRARR